MIILDFEEFIEEAWDYVSKYVVTDIFWEENNDFILELTYELYQKHLKSGVVYEGDIKKAKFTAKEAGRLLESFFSMLVKYKNTLKY